MGDGLDYRTTCVRRTMTERGLASRDEAEERQDTEREEEGVRDWRGEVVSGRERGREGRRGGRVGRVRGRELVGSGGANTGGHIISAPTPPAHRRCRLALSIPPSRIRACVAAHLTPHRVARPDGLCVLYPVATATWLKICSDILDK